ncbi:MAG: methyltransferase domain-containing protein [Trueperaceae bacterium]
MRDAARPLPTPDAEDLRASVRDYYTRRLDEATRSGSGCCPPAATNVVFEASPTALPSFGCGDAHALTALAAGETVVDLGSGAGLDAFRAAEAVGPAGRVIGVDMTPAMIAHARAAAERLGLRHVTFREGRIEALPIEDGAADVVISNCVVNLSSDVEAVLREAFRVLRPGGRLRVTDTFRRGPAVADPATDGWCACVDGAHDPDALAALADRVGFAEVAVVANEGASGCGDTFSATLCATRPRGAVAAAAAAGEVPA